MGEPIADRFITLAVNLGREALDLLFPPSCVGCGSFGVVWCRDCDRRRKTLGAPRCSHCDGPLRGVEQVCRCCEQDPSSIRARSCFRYNPPVSSALLHMKYRPNRRLAAVLGGWLAEAVEGANWRPDLIVPVPLGERRQAQRGFNQAGLLASACARQLEIPWAEDVLVRHRETESQVGLGVEARQENVRDAFQGARELKGEWVLVVDDLYTTGATLRACGRALLEAGAGRVCGVTVARAVLDPTADP